MNLDKIENWLQDNNVEMQCIPVSENENVEETALKMLKKLMHEWRKPSW